MHSEQWSRWFAGRDWGRIQLSAIVRGCLSSTSVVVITLILVRSSTQSEYILPNEWMMHVREILCRPPPLGRNPLRRRPPIPSERLCTGRTIAPSWCLQCYFMHYHRQRLGLCSLLSSVRWVLALPRLLLLLFFLLEQRGHHHQEMENGKQERVERVDRIWGRGRRITRTMRWKTSWKHQSITTRARECVLFHTLAAVVVGGSLDPLFSCRPHYYRDFHFHWHRAYFKEPAKGEGGKDHHHHHRLLVY